jgi:hypothetical protein
MPYDAVAHGRFDVIDYRAAFPFISWRRPDLLEKLTEWLSMNPPRLELATLAYDELLRRGENRARAARRLFPDHLPPIPWLTAAREEVVTNLSTSSTPRGRGRVYVILRSGYSARSGCYGAYVGVTCRSVECRFIQHRTGIRSARGLGEHGIELLYSLFPGINPIPGGAFERRIAETRLHRLLATKIPKVTGDIFDPIPLGHSPSTGSSPSLPDSSEERQVAN